ncbi:MAG TPA: hypothetical protein VN973_11835 [Candidatus Dormibacteraeota bacterium]|nr:hypothetical protein [Candidatus Dormibacteraeota bacterium]
MKVRWSRREVLVKSLIAAGGAVAAHLSGVMPELGWAAQPKTPDHLQPPDYMRQALRQDEIVGRDADALLTSVSNSPDVREVLRQASIGKVDLAALKPHAVRTVLEDGQIVVAVSAVLPDQEHVIVHYQHGSGPQTNAFIYKATADHKANLVAASAAGRPVRRPAETSDSSNTVLAAGCPSCTHPCTQCCGYDLWGILECCIWCSAFFECPPCFLACALSWCSGCVWFHCYHCTSCCQDWWCF